MFTGAWLCAFTSQLAIWQVWSFPSDLSTYGQAVSQTRMIQKDFKTSLTGLTAKGAEWEASV